MVRKSFFWLHKWVGLLSGIIVLVVSLTGCIYVFQEEAKELFYSKRLFIEPQSESALPLSELKEKAQLALGSSYGITRAEIYPDRSRTWIFRASKTDDKAFGYWNYYHYYYRVYINPYTGKVVHIEDSKHEFFQLILSLHMNLLLGKAIGGPLVGYSTALFLLLLLSGLVLWWPKAWTKKKTKGAFRVKWKASRKRLVYDLHNVLGFYLLIPAVILTLTGLVYSFKWVDSSLQAAFNLGSPAVERMIPKSNRAASPEHLNHSLDAALTTVLHANPTADMLSIRFRPAETAPIDIQTRLLKSKTSAFVWYYFDKQTGQNLMEYGHQDVVGGEKARTLNYDVHVGSIGGLGTKIFAFFASLICASLPVTGYLMWYHKKRKKKKIKPQRLAAQPH